MKSSGISSEVGKKRIDKLTELLDFDSKRSHFQIIDIFSLMRYRDVHLVTILEILFKYFQRH